MGGFDVADAHFIEHAAITTMPCVAFAFESISCHALLFRAILAFVWGHAADAGGEEVSRKCHQMRSSRWRFEMNTRHLKRPGHEGERYCLAQFRWRDEHRQLCRESHFSMLDAASCFLQAFQLMPPITGAAFFSGYYRRGRLSTGPGFSTWRFESVAAAHSYGRDMATEVPALQCILILPRGMAGVIYFLSS